MKQQLRAVIVDDELEAQKGLRSILGIFCSTVEVVGTAESAKGGVELILQTKPDLVFLDIEMPHSNGFDLLETIGDRAFETIFVTAYSQYAIEAIRVNAMDYLLKPIDPDDLIRAVENAGKRIAEKKNTDYSALFETLKKSQNERISIPTKTGTRYLDLAEIVRIESSNNYSNIILTEEKPMLVSRTLKSFETTLTETDMVRVHQRHMINLNRVKEYSKADGSHLIMDNGDRVPVSRANRKSTEELLKGRIRTV